MKFLIWAVAALLVVMMFRKLLSGSGKAAGREQTAKSEPMLRCAECGTHFPVSEALYGPAGAAYCSERHRSGAR